MKAVFTNGISMVDQGYRYAHRFTQGFVGWPEEWLQDEPIDYPPGDDFLGLNMQPQVVSARWEFYLALRRQGVYVHLEGCGR
ncbi:MAG: hypothetical protein IT487_13645 [Chromatiaceae bacterium]|nr:hypothetical protein [Chromatiaceae bacterium]